jgi:hypothetical protein
MARTPLLSFDQLAADHAAADALGVSVVELRDRRLTTRSALSETQQVTESKLGPTTRDTAREDRLGADDTRER